MKHRSIAALILAAACAVSLAEASDRIKRDLKVRAEFMRQNPCPPTGATRGPCKGYIVDHVIALKRGGADHPSNMQWQTVHDARIKDRIE